MKKILSGLIVLLILGLAALGGATWYGGSRVESELKQGLTAVNGSLRNFSAQIQLEPPLQLALHSFQRHPLDSDAVLTLEGPADLPAERPQIDLKLVHGPVLWRPGTGAGTPVLGQGLAHLQLDLSALSADQQALLSQAFGGREPLSGLAWRGFDQQTNYQVNLNPLDYRDETSGVAVTLTEASLTGSVSESRSEGGNILTLPSHFRAGAFSMALPGDSGSSELRFSGITANGNYDLNADGLALRSDSDLAVSGVEFTAPDLPEPVSFDLVGHSSMGDDAGNLNLASSLKLQVLKTPFAPETEASLDFGLTGLNAKAMAAFQQQLQALQGNMNEVNRLTLAGLKQVAADAQADGALTDDTTGRDASPAAAEPDVAAAGAGLAAAETAAEQDTAAAGTGLNPEDQARLAELSGELEQQQQQLLDLALEKLVNPGHTRFTNALAINNENGKASLDLDLTYQGPPDGMTLNSTTLPTLTPDQLLALVRGKVDFGFDPALFPLAALFLEHPAIAKEDERYVAHLELAGDRLVLNGEDMTLEAFIALLEPDAGGLLMDPGDLEDGEPVDGDMPNSGQGEDGMMDAEPTGDEAVDDGSMVDEPEMIPAATPAAGEAGTETAPVPAR